MKHKSSLISMALLVCTGSYAQNLTANWPKATAPEFSSWAAETEFYLYNIGAGGFYINHQGSSSSPYYGTRATVNDSIGTLVKFTRTNPSAIEEDFDVDGVKDNTYLLTSFVTNKNAWYCTYVASNDYTIWTDNNSQSIRYYNVVENGDYFKIETNAPVSGLTEISFDGKYLGTYDDGIGLVYMNDPEIIGDVTFYDDWVAVSPSVYETYIDEAKKINKLYNAAQSLKKAIMLAYEENPGINLSEQIAVYNNTESSLEELTNAETSINQTLIEFLAQKATPDTPMDFTSALTNPDFSSDDATGWTGSPTVSYSCAEKYNTTFNVYQTLTGLPEGVYEVGIQAFYRAGIYSNDYSTYIADSTLYNYAKLYGSSNIYGKVEKPVKRAVSERSAEAYDSSDMMVEDGCWIANSMYGASLRFADNAYKNNLFVGVAADDTLKVGFKKETTITDDWTIFDSFTLKYYGSTIEAYKLWANSVIEGLTDYNLESTYHGAPEEEVYKNVIDKIENAGTKEEIIESVISFSSAEDTLGLSITNYAAYIAKIEEIYVWLEEGTEQGLNMDVDAVYKLSDYVQIEAGDNETCEMWGYPNGAANDIVNRDNSEFAGKLSAEEIAIETEYLDGLLQEAIRNALKEGSDLTSLLVNPDFEIADGYGWSYDTGLSAPNNWYGYATSTNNHNAEAFQRNFDVYQTVEGLPNGLYQVSVQAFYRSAGSEAAYLAYLNDPEMNSDAKIYSYVYLNDFTSPVKSLFEGEYTEAFSSSSGDYYTIDDHYYPSTVAGASLVFSNYDDDNNYTQYIYGLVTDGTMKVGIRNTEGGTSNSEWTLWDNFKITYMGKNVNALYSVLSNYITRADFYESLTFGDPDKETLSAAVKAGTKALEAKDSETMYTALYELVDAMSIAEKSVIAYNDFLNGVSDLGNAIDIYFDANEDAINNAYELLETVQELGTELDGTEIAEYTTQVNNAINALKVPNYSDASDNNPIDFTKLITNPTFDTIGDFTGWNATGSDSFSAGGTKSTNAECYNNNFNTFQDITGLPAGIYEIRVNGFHRTGTASQDYENWNTYKDSEKDPTLTAYLYAQGSEGTSSTPVPHLCIGGRTDTEYGTTNAGSATSVWYVPNSMAEAELAIHATDDEGNDLNIYLVSLYAKVGEDGRLRIGVYKQDEVVTNACWCVFDDFQLYYFGSESSNNQDEDEGTVNIDNINNDMNSVVAIYTLSGIQVNELQKGTNILKTVGTNGSIKVKKVFVR